MTGRASDNDAALDAAIAGRIAALPDDLRPGVRDGVRRLQASVDRLRAAGFDQPPSHGAEEAGA